MLPIPFVLLSPPWRAKHLSAAVSAEREVEILRFARLRAARFGGRAQNDNKAKGWQSG
jgi:hypothetical protein